MKPTTRAGWMNAIAAFLVALTTIVSEAGSFMSTRPWLGDRSSWSETVEAGSQPVGWWAVGNQSVFGIVGPDLFRARIHQLTGPHIMLANVMNNGSAFGPAWIDLEADGAPVRFERATLSRVRGTDVVAMELESPTVGMTVVTYAPFGVDAIMRTIVVENRGTVPLGDVAITATIGRAHVEEGRVVDQFEGSTAAAAAGGVRHLASAFVEGATGAAVDGGAALRTEVGDIDAGAEAVRTQVIGFAMDDPAGAAAVIREAAADPSVLLEQTRDDWHAWLATTPRVESGDGRFVDLLDDTAILCRIQTAEPQCAAGPMEFFAGVWIRDSNGPFRYALRMGQLDDARRMLDYAYRASALSGRISNFVPMDVDATRPLPEPLDWATMPCERAEIPAWHILQHRWYVEFTGDLEPVREHWEFLRRCLDGQLVDESGQPVHTENFGSVEPGENAMYRFPHHGDETWIYPGFEVLNSEVFPEPNDHPHWDAFSVDSTWEFVVAADTLAGFARRLGFDDDAERYGTIAADARAACERDYWQEGKGFYAPALNMRSLDRHQPPFTMVNLNPLWIGYLQPDDPKAISNCEQTLRYTWNPNAIPDATETLRIYVGMQPGMVLWNLALIDHPLAERAFEALSSVASPSGEYTEKQVTERDGYATRYLGHRIRPWEGGINLDAALMYLTGIEPDMANGRIRCAPRIPPGSDRVRIAGRRLGDGALTVGVVAEEDLLRYELAWDGSSPLRVSFRSAQPGRRVEELRVGGQPVAATFRDAWGTRIGETELTLEPGVTLAVEAVAPGSTVAAPSIERARYEYEPPTDIEPVDVVLLENEARKGNAADLRTFDHLDGRVSYRLVSAFNPCDASWLRPLLVDGAGEPRPRALVIGPDAIRNSLKYDRWWGDPALTALLRGFMERGGTMAVISAGESGSGLFGDLLGDAEYLAMPVEKGARTAIAPAACEALGLAGGEEPDGTGCGDALLYRGMTPFAGHASESAAATAVALRIGKGVFVAIRGDFPYEQRADLVEALCDPARMEAFRAAISARGELTIPGAFDDRAVETWITSFDGLARGSIGLPEWIPVKGRWRVEEGGYRCLERNGYDFSTVLARPVAGDYRLEIEAAPGEGIYEAGVAINLPGRTVFNRLQMIRFCGPQEIWYGPIDGAFSLEHTWPTGLSPEDTGAHRLSVDVRNSTGACSVYVDDRLIAANVPIRRPLEEGETGHVALVSCRGEILVRKVEIRPATAGDASPAQDVEPEL